MAIATIEQITQTTDTGVLDLARQRFANLWFSAGKDEASVAHGFVNYLNAFQVVIVEPEPRMHTAVMAASLYEEGVKLTSMSHRNRYPMNYEEITESLRGYLTDEVALEIIAEDVSAMPRAVSLTMIDQLKNIHQ